MEGLLFRFPVQGTEAVDVYFLAQAPADPLALPARGPFAGWRRRIFGPAPKP